MTASLEQAIKQVKQLSEEKGASPAEVLMVVLLAIGLVGSSLFNLLRTLKESPSDGKTASIDGQEEDEEEPFWREGFPLPSSSNVLFSKKLKSK